jgi:hypothetical protein
MFDGGFSLLSTEKGEWVKFDDVVEFLKTPTNSAMDAIANKFIDSNDFVVHEITLIRQFVAFVSQQHQ